MIRDYYAFTSRGFVFLVVFPLSTASFAQPPTSFGGWVVDQGAISAPCPSGFECVDIAEDAGFLQRELIDVNTRGVFVQSFLTDPDATGDATTVGFALEDFIQITMGGLPNVPGLASALHIADLEQFTFDFEIMRGWAAPEGFDGTGMIDLRLEALGDRDDPNDDLVSTFLWNGVGRGGVRVGTRQEISQDLGIDTGGGADAAERQVLHMVGASGDLQPNSGQATLPGTDTLTWQAGDAVVAGWLGVESNAGGTLGHQAYMNLTEGQQIMVNDFSNTGPFGWEEETFGPAPSFPDAAQ